MVEFEFEQMRNFMSLHVSDHSGFHYQQFLLNSLHVLRGDELFLSRLQSELQLTQELIQLYPGHEAIWYHRLVDAVMPLLTIWARYIWQTKCECRMYPVKPYNNRSVLDKVSK